MMHESEKSTLSSETSSGCTRCVSWNAIIFPALVAIGLSFLIYLFTTGLSLTAFTSTPEGQLSLAAGGFAWLVVSAYMSMFLVGWIAGVFVRPHRCLGVAHGFAAWCLALILTAILFSQAAISPLGTPAAYFSLHRAAATSQTDVKEQVVTPNTTTKEAVNKLGIGVLAIFFVFFAGALGSCTGGYVGSQSKRREDELKAGKF